MVVYTVVKIVSINYEAGRLVLVDGALMSVNILIGADKARVNT